MKRLYFNLIVVLYCLMANSQSISVSSFKELESDLTANTSGTMEKDQNGETAALIKVVTTQTGFTFDCGSMGIVKTLQKPSEIWVYVPHGVKKMTISHPQLGLLRDYYFNIPIEAARTYEMILVSGTVQTIVTQSSNSQYLVIKVNPSDAVVELENEVLPTTNGIAQKFVKLGSYEYRVQAPYYHTAAGRVDVSDPNNKKIIEISLVPAYGWIEVPSHQEYNGAQVFIDNALAGTIPLKSKKLSSGEHNIKIVKPLYLPFSQDVVVRDDETTQVTPTLSANYSDVTITVDNDADIYVNDERKGTGTWSGKLESGIYLMEAKKEGHRNSIQNIDISADQSNHEIRLSEPIPIYGKLNITSNPISADVYIDEKLIGQTPLYITNLLIGNHDLEIKSGDKEYRANISIDELSPTLIDVVLQAKSNNDNNTLSNEFKPISLSYNLVLSKIVRTTTSTELHLVFHAKAGDWLSISPQTYIKSPYDNWKYTISSVRGIALSPQKKVFSKIEDIHFKLIFPAIPENDSIIDFIEPDSPWQFHGIVIRN